MSKQHTRSIYIFIAVMLMATVLACGSAEEKKMKFFNRGKALYEQGDFVRARLELKNALQIDPKFAEGYYWLGLVGQKSGNFKGSFGALNKAVELDPELLPAQLELGKMLLLARQAEDALEKVKMVLDKEPDNKEALLLKASVLTAQGDDTGSEAICRDLLASGYNKPGVYLLLAAGYARNLQPDAAEKVFKDGIAANPQSVPLHLGLVKFYSDNKQLSDAAAILKKLVDIEPSNPDYKIMLARLYWADGRAVEADHLIANLVATDPADEDIRQTAADFYISVRQFTHAAEILEEGIQKIPGSIRLRIQLAGVKANLQNTDEAIATLEQCLTLREKPADPELLQAKNELARMHLMLKDIEKANGYVDDVLKESANNVDAHFYKGTIYLMQGDGVNAVSELRTVTDEKPGFMPAYISLAQAHLLNKENELAVDTLQSAVKINPKSKDARRALARVYAFVMKDYQAAEEQLRKTVEIDPNDIVSLEDSGNFFLAKRDFEDAEELYRQMITIQPKNPSGYLRMSRLYIAQQQPDKALAVLEQGYAQNPLATQLLAALIQSYMSQKKHDQALALCEQRIADNLQDVVAYNLIGWVHTDLKNYSQAETALKKAIDLQPLWPAPHSNLARLYLLQGRKQEAVQRLKGAIESNPKNREAYLSLAMLYEQDNDFTNSMEIYELALKHNPQFWFAANNLAFLISEESQNAADLERAMQLAKKALQLQPNNPAVLDTIGWVHYRMGQYSQALNTIEKALQIAPDAAVLNYHLGMVLVKLGRADEGKDKLVKALAGNEDFIGRDTAEKTLKQIS